MKILQTSLLSLILAVVGCASSSAGTDNDSESAAENTSGQQAVPVGKVPSIASAFVADSAFSNVERQLQFGRACPAPPP